MPAKTFRAGGEDRDHRQMSTSDGGAAVPVWGRRPGAREDNPTGPDRRDPLSQGSTVAWGRAPHPGHRWRWPCRCPRGWHGGRDRERERGGAGWDRVARPAW